MPQSPRQIEESTAQLDKFAELLSLGIELVDIADRMSIQRARASQLLMKLRAKYGWQAN